MRHYNVMHTRDKDDKEELLPIRLVPEEVSEEQIKKSWDAISKAITELEKKKSASKKKGPSRS